MGIANENFLKNYHISKQDIDNFLLLSEKIIIDLKSLIDKFYEIILSSKENIHFMQYIANATEEDLIIHKETDYNHWMKFLRGTFDDAYLEDRKAVGNKMVNYQMPFSNYTYSISLLGEIVLEYLADKNILTLKRWHSFKKLLDIDSNLIIEQYIHYTNNIVHEHNNVLKTMSLPISEILDKIIYAPIIGNILNDSKGIIQRIIQYIANNESQIIILDIIGAINITEDNAKDIARLYKGCQLMGCEFIISGVSAQSAPIMAQIEELNNKNLFSTTSMIQALNFALKLRMRNNHLVKI